VHAKISAQDGGNIENRLFDALSLIDALSHA